MWIYIFYGLIGYFSLGLIILSIIDILIRYRTGKWDTITFKEFTKKLPLFSWVWLIWPVVASFYFMLWKEDEGKI